MKDPDIIRHSISATHFTLTSLGFHQEAYHTYSPPLDNSKATKHCVPDSEQKIQGIKI